MFQTWTPDTNEPELPDYRTVKAWFQQCRDLAEQVEAQKQKIQRIRDTAEKCTQSMSGMPMGGGAGDKVGFAVERIDTEERNLKQMELDLCELRIEAARRAYCLSGSARSEKQAKCICGWYIDLKPQKKTWACPETIRSPPTSTRGLTLWQKSGRMYKTTIESALISTLYLNRCETHVNRSVVK